MALVELEKVAIKSAISLISFLFFLTQSLARRYNYLWTGDGSVWILSALSGLESG
jgi:hypothetical protein